jgi:hypothetical protein
MPADGLSLVLFDFLDSEVVTAREGESWIPELIKRCRHVYFLRWLDNPAVLRVRITEREVEQVSDLTNRPTTGNVGPWLGLGPDDSLLLLKHIES